MTLEQKKWVEGLMTLTSVCEYLHANGITFAQNTILNWLRWEGVVAEVGPLKLIDKNDVKKVISGVFSYQEYKKKSRKPYGSLQKNRQTMDD